MKTPPQYTFENLDYCTGTGRDICQESDFFFLRGGREGSMKKQIEIWLAKSLLASFTYRRQEFLMEARLHPAHGLRKWNIPHTVLRWSRISVTAIPMSLCAQIPHKQGVAMVSATSQLQKVTQNITSPEIPTIIITAQSGK